MTSYILGDLFTGKLVKLAAQGADLKEAMARWSNDAEYLRLLDTGAARPRPVEYFTPDEKDKHEDEPAFKFAIRTLADDKLIGECDLYPTWNHQNAWVGIGIGEPAYRSKGYGTDAMRLLVAYGFRELGLYKVTLGLFAYNTRALRCYEKVGFVREQLKRQAYFRDGQRYDEITMGILRPDWEQMQETAEAAR